MINYGDVVTFMTIAIICVNKDPMPWYEALKAVDPTLNVQIWKDDDPPSDAEFALCWNHPAGVLQNFPKLKCICSMGAGIDHFLADSLLPKGVPLVRIVDPALAHSMFEYLHAAVMRFVQNFDHYMREQSQSFWCQRRASTKAATTVGLMGLGHLGEYAARRFFDDGFKVLGWSRSEKSLDGVETFCGAQSLDDFLSQTDILICLLPLTPETENILDLATFRKLPIGASVINVARGAHLVDADLITALDEGHLNGACLDVFREEPLPSTHRFWGHSRILVTPHCSSLSDPFSVTPQVVQNYRIMQSNGQLLNQVDPMRGY